MYGYDVSDIADNFFFAYDASGNVWNGSAFVAWDDGDYEDYKIAATEKGSSGRYEATAPTGTATYELRREGATLDDCIVVWTGETPVDTVAAINADSTQTTARTAAINAASQTLLDADGYDLEESMKIILSALCGKLTSVTGSAVFRAVDDSKARITSTTDITGSRTAVTIDVTG